MSTTLPERADIVWYKKAAKKMLAALRAGKPATTLAEAQLAVARERGFASWRQLVATIDARKPAAVDPSQFLTAIRDNDAASAAKLLINIPALANARDPHGAPVLSVAVAVGAERPAIVRLLLDHGADPTARYGRFAHTPLSWAMTVGAFRSADVLLKAGAKADLFCAAGLDRVDDDVAALFDADGFARPATNSAQRGRS